MPPERCPTTVTVMRNGQFACEMEEGHQGSHEAALSGEWDRVIWGDSTTVVLMPGGRRTGQ